MNTNLQIAMIIGLLFYFFLIIYFLRKKTISLKYTLLWIIAGAIMTVLAIFPDTLKWLAGFLGIVTPSNALFAIVLFFTIVILMSLTSIVSKLNEKNKKLAEYIALLEKQVRDLEEKK